MSAEFNHTCDNCGDTPKQELCYCKSCKNEEVEDAYEEGRKVGIEDGRKEANNQ